MGSQGQVLGRRSRRSGHLKTGTLVTWAIPSHSVSAAKTFVLHPEHSGLGFQAQKHMKELAVATVVTTSGHPSACLL